MRLKKYNVSMGVRMTALEKEQLKAIAQQHKKHPSELVRACIDCLLKENKCIVIDKLKTN